MANEFNLSVKMFKKFIEDNFSYSDIGMNEDGEYGENKLSWMWKEDYNGKISDSLRKKMIEIIKKKGANYFKWPKNSI